MRLILIFLILFNSQIFEKSLENDIKMYLKCYNQVKENFFQMRNLKYYPLSFLAENGIKILKNNGKFHLKIRINECLAYLKTDIIIPEEFSYLKRTDEIFFKEMANELFKKLEKLSQIDFEIFSLKKGKSFFWKKIKTFSFKR